MVRKIFTAPQELLDQLKAQSTKEYSNDSEVIRRALRLYFQQQEIGVNVNINSDGSTQIDRSRANGMAKDFEKAVTNAVEKCNRLG